MKLRFYQIVIAAIFFGASYIRSFENFFSTFQQSATAVGDTLASTKETIDGLVQLVASIQQSVNQLSQKVTQLTKTATGIVSNNPQESLKNSFGTITGGLDSTMDLLPVVKELSGIVAIVGNKLLPVISKYPGVSPDVTKDIAKVSASIASITGEINRIKASLELWIPKIKNLSTTLGGHAVEMAAQVEGTIADTKKIF